MRPVSYTHLDVSKRQRENTPQVQEERARASIRPFRRADLQAAWFRGAEAGAEKASEFWRLRRAVSYTHRDVYKRQVFVLLKTTNLGMYAIVGASTVYGVLRNLIFTPLYAAKCLKVKWHTFYGDIVLGLVSIGVICLVALPFELLVDINSWVRLFAVGIAAGILALLVNFFVVLRKTERQMVLEMVKKKIARRQDT